MAPVRVYLDNQDFSRLYQPPNEELRGTAAELLAFADSGTAVFLYSYWHIFEFLQPADIKHLPDRRARARFLKRLCGANALPFFMDVLEDKQPIPGVWIPSSIVRKVIVDLRATIEKTLTERPSNRSMRRKVRSQRAWRQATERYFQGSTFERRIRHELGLTDDFIAATPISRLFKNQITEDEFRVRLGRMFCEPEFFFDQWYVRDRKENPIKEQAIHIGRKWMETIAVLRKATKDYVDLRAKAVKGRRAYYDHLRASDLPDALKKIVVAKLPKLAPPIDLRETLAGTDAAHPRLRYLECYLRFHLTSEGREPKDVVDLMHLFYTEDVDLMRCDRAIFHIMKNCPHLPIGRLVDRIADLPERIRSLSAMEGSSPPT